MKVTYSYDLARFDFATIRKWLAGTYWSPGINRAKVEKGFRASTLCVGAFAGGVQIGAARCVSDTTRFAYVADVYVEATHRRQGIGREMVRRLLTHRLLRNIDSWYLLTRDAHQVYAGLGFEVFPRPHELMRRKKPSS